MTCTSISRCDFYDILGYDISSVSKDGSDIQRSPTVHMVKAHFLLENMDISE